MPKYWTLFLILGDDIDDVSKSEESSDDEELNVEKEPVDELTDFYNKYSDWMEMKGKKRPSDILELQLSLENM